MELKDKVAIVTGGASGLGLATVEAFVDKGAKVAVFDLNEQQGEALSQKYAGQVMYQNVNVADEQSVSQAIDMVVAQFGELHIVANYAGIGSASKTFGSKGPHSLDAYMKVVMVNQVGTFNVARLGAAKMAENTPEGEDGSRGVIINIASVAAFEGQIGQVAYAATKGAVVGMTLPMARDLAPLGIRVNTIAPGLVHTPLFDTVAPEVYQTLEASTVYPKRLGKTAEIAKLAVHIVENNYLNGECIRIDAAIRMQPK